MGCAQKPWEAAKLNSSELMESCLRDMLVRYHENERRLGSSAKLPVKNRREQPVRFQRRGSREGGGRLGRLYAPRPGPRLQNLHPPKSRRAFSEEKAKHEYGPEEERNDREDDA